MSLEILEQRRHSESELLLYLKRQILVVFPLFNVWDGGFSVKMYNFAKYIMRLNMEEKRLKQGEIGLG